MARPNIDDLEAKQIKKEFLDKIAAIDDTTLNQYSIDDIKSMLYKDIEDDTIKVYSDKITAEEKNWEKTYGGIDTKKYPQYLKEYLAGSKMLDTILKALKNEVKSVADEFITETIEPAFNLKKTYDKIKGYETIGESVPEFLESEKNRILTHDEFEGAFEQETTAEKLRNNYAKLKLEVGRRRYELADEVSRKDLLTNKEQLKKLQEVIKYVGIDKLGERATGEINAKVAEGREELNKTNDEYNGLKKELNVFFSAKEKGLDEQFRSLAITYGYNKLRGLGTESIETKDEDYKEITTALIKKEAREEEMAGNANYIARYIQIIRGINPRNPQQRMSKSAAIKELKRLKTDLASIESRVKIQLDKDLKSIYQHVLACSEFDSTALGVGEGYMILSEHEILQDEGVMADGSHGETGLLRYFKDYVGKAEEIGFWGGLWEKGKSLVSRREPQKTKVKITRTPKIDIKKIEHEVVRKHKHATYRNLDDIKEEDLISIKEIMELGMGLAVRENNKKKIELAVNAIKSLNSNSDIDCIYKTYLTAASLGSKINRDAREWTEVRGDEFSRMDDYINRKAGFTYRIKDTAIDTMEGLFDRAGLGTEKIRDLGGSVNWDFHRTAIKPNTYAPVMVALAGLGGLVALWGILNKSATGEPLTRETSYAYSRWEDIMNLAFFVGGTMIGKKEAPKHYPHVSPEAPKPVEKPKKESPKAKPPVTHASAPVTPPTHVTTVTPATTVSAATPAGPAAAAHAH